MSLWNNSSFFRISSVNITYGHSFQIFYAKEGCWCKAEEHINAWIAKDCDHVADGLAGSIDDLRVAEASTETPSTCLNITDMDVDEDPRPVDVVGAVEVDHAHDHEFDNGDEDSDEDEDLDEEDGD